MAANNRYSLSKPYDLEGEMTAFKVAQLDEMLTELYGAASQDESRIEEVEEIVEEPAEAETPTVVLVTKSITELQIESGNTSPIELVAAVAGKVIVPLQALIVVTTTVVYTSSPTWSLRHGGISGNLTGTVAPNLQATVTGYHVIGHVTTLGYSANPTGASLVLFLNANPTGTGSATAKVQLAYYLADSISTV